MWCLPNFQLETAVIHKQTHLLFTRSVSKSFYFTRYLFTIMEDHTSSPESYASSTVFLSVVVPSAVTEERLVVEKELCRGGGGALCGHPCPVHASLRTNWYPAGWVRILYHSGLHTSLGLYRECDGRYAPRCRRWWRRRRDEGPTTIWSLHWTSTPH